MYNILITGGAGFIGSHLVEYLLSKNNKIIVLDNFSTGRAENLKKLPNRKNLKIYNVDISNQKNISKYFKNIKIVFHLAALADIVPSIEKPKEYFKSNVVGTLNILECCRAHSIKKIIYTASSSCYGIPKSYPTNELSKIQPQYPYALTKYLGEQMLLHWGKVYNINVISLRFFNVYGPRSRTSGTYGAVFGVFLKQKLSNKPFTIVGNGKQKRDFTYVSDIVSSLVKASKSKIKNEIFNIGSSKCYSVNYLTKLLGANEVVYIPKRPGEPDCTWANINKAKKYLKWKPKVNLENGVKKILKNIDYWSEAPLWTEKRIAKATKKWFEFLDK
mgnify:CR=1 FL=1|tara:strand:- start:1848 stop:2840 length:993 start_codon:yes stop_codon:yes gene_type:complete